MMDTREEIIRLWLDMWLRQEDFGIREIGRASCRERVS